jgi:uncharacterized membrane protein
MKDLVLFSHIIAGSLVLLLGLIIMIIKKGRTWHIRLGWMYVISMWWVCISAFASILIFDFSLFLLVIGIMTFYFTFNGLRVLRRGRTDSFPWYDYFVTYLVMAVGIGLIGYGLFLIAAGVGHTLLIALSIVFGFFTFYGALNDYRFFKNGRGDDPQWWLYQHIGSMGGSYISALSAFAVQNGQYMGLHESLSWVPWILPGVIGGFVISNVIGKYKKNRKNQQVNFPTRRSGTPIHS